MSTQKLKDLLDEIAEEVRPAQVHQGAITQARRATRRTAMLAGSVALVIIVGGVLGLNLGQQSPPDAVPPASPPQSIDGDLYVAVEPGLLRVGGTDDPTWTTRVPEDETAITETLSVSPDGRYATWFDADHNPHLRGIAADTAEVDYALADSPADLPCNSPVWTPDSTRLYLQLSEDSAIYWHAATGDLTHTDPAPGCDVQVATTPDGRDVRYSLQERNGKTEVLRTDAAGDTTVTGVGEAVRDTGNALTELTAVSPDGGFACVGTSDISIAESSQRCRLVVETDTAVVLDLGTDWYGTAAVFDIPGGLLTLDSTGTLTLRDFTGAALDQVPTEGAGADSTPPDLIGFVPR